MEPNSFDQRSLGLKSDKYASLAELAKGEVYGADYRVCAIERPNSPVLILAPHGGGIEAGTTQLADLVAGTEHNFFSFEGLKRSGNRALHITSSRFDHPVCLSLIARCAIAVGVHGCVGESGLFVGGLDEPLVALLVRHLQGRGLPASAHGHAYPGRHPLNICNRTTRQCGAQLELTNDLRAPWALARIAAAVRDAIDQHLMMLGFRSFTAQS